MSLFPGTPLTDIFPNGAELQGSDGRHNVAIGVNAEFDAVTPGDGLTASFLNAHAGITSEPAAPQQRPEPALRPSVPSGRAY